MSQARLRIVRIVISLLILALVAFVFISPAPSAYHHLRKGFSFFQFVPSLLSFVSLISWTTIGFIIILLLTVLFGRAYCSFLCPLGTIQDVLVFIKRKVKRKKKYRYLRPLPLLRYTVLGLTILIFLFGSNLLVEMLDPFSLSGRFLSQLARPVFIFINNGLAQVLQSWDIYSVYLVSWKTFIPAVFLVTLGFFLMILLFSIFRGRDYCNTVCPVGTLLGLFSIRPVYKIRIDHGGCTGCRLCELACKAGCIDSEKKEIDYSRCIVCFDCIPACSGKSITFSSVPARENPEIKTFPSTGRRDFLKGMTVLGLGLVVESCKILPATAASSEEKPITPPGSLGLDHFTQYCTACQLCVSRCPTQVLTPSFFEYGWSGMLIPKMDYMRSFCNYECVICSEVCPTGAIRKITTDEKKQIQIGKVWLRKKPCIVYDQKTDCGACSEHCPTKAVYMVPYHGLFAPEVDPSICVGCGACQYVCPTIPDKAIMVVPHAIHRQAQLPANEEIPDEVLPSDEFPF